MCRTDLDDFHRNRKIPDDVADNFNLYLQHKDEETEKLRTEVKDLLSTNYKLNEELKMYQANMKAMEKMYQANMKAMENRIKFLESKLYLDYKASANHAPVKRINQQISLMGHGGPPDRRDSMGLGGPARGQGRCGGSMNRGSVGGYGEARGDASYYHTAKRGRWESSYSYNYQRSGAEYNSYDSGNSSHPPANEWSSGGYFSSSCMPQCDYASRGAGAPSAYGNPAAFQGGYVQSSNGNNVGQYCIQGENYTADVTGYSGGGGGDSYLG